MELSQVHDCEQCHNKIVCISIDEFGNTYCGYCHQQVNYKPYYDNLYKQEILQLINTTSKKEETKWQPKKKNKRKRKVLQRETL